MKLKNLGYFIDKYSLPKLLVTNTQEGNQGKNYCFHNLLSNMRQNNRKLFAK